LAVMMLDGVEIAERIHVVALGITTAGVKIPLGLWEGSTENATLARILLAGLGQLAETLCSTNPARACSRSSAAPGAT
jgi:hypothetical protein